MPDFLGHWQLLDLAQCQPRALGGRQVITDSVMINVRALGQAKLGPIAHLVAIPHHIGVVNKIDLAEEI